MSPAQATSHQGPRDLRIAAADAAHHQVIAESSQTRAVRRALPRNNLAAELAEPHRAAMPAAIGR